jgi:hypothetical protein
MGNRKKTLSSAGYLHGALALVGEFSDFLHCKVIALSLWRWGA